MNEITIERIPHSGMLVLSTWINDVHFTKKYIGYSKRDAVRRFKRDAKEFEKEFVVEQK